jgi:hypothetical protein
VVSIFSNDCHIRLAGLGFDLALSNLCGQARTQVQRPLCSDSRRARQ